jgi:NAD(P)-dependent dehydrogenase (short-subunit alcohol dehydrogenase family)
MDMDLSKKRILVSGASSGIGRSACIHLSNLGADITLIGRDLNRLNDTLSQLYKGKHIIRQYDLREISGIENLIKELVVEHGSFNGMVYCAGQSKSIPLQLNTTDVINETLLINTLAFVELVRCIAKKGNNAGGSIVYVSSIMSSIGRPLLTSYSMSKAAGEAACRCLAIELASKNIRVNSIAPGFINTPMLDDYKSLAGEDAINKIRQRQYLGIGEPSDVANLICFLISDASRFITGSTLTIDGGYTSN